MSLPRECQEAMKDIGAGVGGGWGGSSTEKCNTSISKIINVVPCNDVQELWSENCLL